MREYRCEVLSNDVKYLTQKGRFITWRNERIDNTNAQEGENKIISN
jgi:hypothetical protein